MVLNCDFRTFWGKNKSINIPNMEVPNQFQTLFEKTTILKINIMRLLQSFEYTLMKKTNTLYCLNAITDSKQLSNGQNA